MKASIDTRLSWYVVRTNIKCEDRAASSLHAAGYDVYLPRMRKDIVHHRTKCVLTKEFPLFNRYLFVGMSNSDFYTARACDGVECFLGINGTPIRVPAAHVERFFTAEINMEFDDTTKAKIHRGEIEKDAKRQLKRTFPKGASVQVKDSHPFGGFFGQVVSVSGKGKIKAMLEIFGGLTPVEFDAADIEPVLDELPRCA